MDGITYLLKADTSTGHFEITDEYDEDDNPTPVNNSQGFTNIDSVDKKTLKKKFFELNT